jgi:Flp pilus assembly protein TadB
MKLSMPRLTYFIILSAVVTAVIAAIADLPDVAAVSSIGVVMVIAWVVHRLYRRR